MLFPQKFPNAFGSVPGTSGPFGSLGDGVGAARVMVESKAMRRMVGRDGTCIIGVMVWRFGFGFGLAGCGRVGDDGEWG